MNENNFKEHKESVDNTPVWFHYLYDEKNIEAQCDRAVCVLCSGIAACRTSSVKRHFETNHKTSCQKKLSLLSVCLVSEGKPTEVFINLDIMDIDEIAEERMEYSMQFYVNEYWKDTRLNISNRKHFQIPKEILKFIWTPDIIFENSKGGWVYQLAVPNIIVKTHLYGYLHRFTRYNMKIACSMFLQNFPMDTQRCFLSIASSWLKSESCLPFLFLQLMWGCGSPVVKVSNHGRHVMSSIPVPLKTRRVGQRCTLNLSRAETSSRWCGVVVRRGVPAQVSSTSLDHGSKLRGPSPKALV
ncbi:gamma-aminobutyric acid receptor subunit rho-3 [Trichonephila clavipes]|nr:gamma-aminobutyric acid receptor subunit rho-3 [Trichonephila clavipes]